jgi:hypothetical protein
MKAVFLLKQLARHMRELSRGLSRRHWHVNSPPNTNARCSAGAPGIWCGAFSQAIRFVRDSFWACRTFTTLEECNRQAHLWRDDVAHQRRWPDDGLCTVAQAFADEQPRLLPLPLHPFNPDQIVEIQSRKTIYVRFDLNDSSIPPEALGRP